MGYNDGSHYSHYQEVNKGTVHGGSICGGAPKVSHLMFADDVVLFVRATNDEATIVTSSLKSCPGRKLIMLNLRYFSVQGQGWRKETRS